MSNFARCGKWRWVHSTCQLEACWEVELASQRNSIDRLPSKLHSGIYQPQDLQIFTYHDIPAFKHLFLIRSESKPLFSHVAFQFFDGVDYGIISNLPKIDGPLIIISKFVLFLEEQASFFTKVLRSTYIHFQLSSVANWTLYCWAILPKFQP